MEVDLMTRTIHVIPEGKNWAVKREGKAGEVFATRTDAIAAARRLAKETAPSQIVVYTREGTIAASEVCGLPKIVKSRVKSSLGTKNIQKAVTELALSRLVSHTP